MNAYSWAPLHIPMSDLSFLQHLTLKYLTCPPPIYNIWSVPPPPTPISDLSFSPFNIWPLKYMTCSSTYNIWSVPSPFQYIMNCSLMQSCLLKFFPFCFDSPPYLWPHRSLTIWFCFHLQKLSGTKYALCATFLAKNILMAMRRRIMNKTSSVWVHYLSANSTWCESIMKRHNVDFMLS